MQLDGELQFYKSLFGLSDQATTVAWILCKDPGMPLIFSRFARQVFGEPVHIKDIRAKVIEIVHEDDHREALNSLDEVAITGRLTQIRVRIRRTDTQEYGWFDCSFAPLSRDGGHVTQWAFRAHDVNAEVRAQQALCEADQRKDAFIALLGHELRNPLSPIINSLALIRAHRPNEAILHEVDLIERQTRQMVRLINDLLDVSRLDHDRIHLETERFDLCLTLEQSREVILRAEADMSHRLTLALPDWPVMVLGDQARMRQVVGNLMRNAVSYSPPGSPVTLSLSVTTDGEARIDLTDAGIGIASDRLATLFEPFSKPDDAVRHPRAGLGLGLSLARRLIEMQGGRLTVHSAGPGLGSTFSVFLPLAEPVSSTQPIAAKQPEAPPARALSSVLVVDDNERAADSLTRLLRLSGHSARAAHDGPTGLDLYQSLHPDVVILDISMPGMSGVELARLLRAQPGARALRIYAVSGFPASEKTDPTDQALFDRYLVKPVDLNLLRQMLEPPERERLPS